VASGQSTLALFENCDHGGWSSKTCPRCSPAALMWSEVISELLDSRSPDPSLCPPRRLAPSTSERGFGSSPKTSTPSVPTPTACDHKGSGRHRLERGANNNLRDWFKINYGFLYPPVRVVEWLMGYPTEHTDSGEPVTRSSPTVRSSSSRPSKRGKRT
jgi:hypothetical protein